MTETSQQRNVWDLALVGDELPPHNGWPCAARHGPWDCLRLAEHTGQHVATTGDTVQIVVAVWDSAPVPRSGSLDRRLRGVWT